MHRRTLCPSAKSTTVSTQMREVVPAELWNSLGMGSGWVRALAIVKTAHGELHDLVHLRQLPRGAA